MFVCAFLNAQNGVGIFPIFDNFGGNFFNGYDTTGYINGTQLKEVRSKKYWRPKLRPTFFQTYREGKRMMEFYVDGGFFQNEGFGRRGNSFFKERYTSLNLTLMNVKHVRLLTFAKGKLSLWAGINRGLDIFQYKSESQDPNMVSLLKNTYIASRFSIFPHLQYKYNEKLSFSLVWENPASWTLGFAFDKHKTDKVDRDLVLHSDLQLALVQPKLNRNLRIGARYVFQTPKKEDIVTPVKPKKYSKTTWGIGAAANISTYLPDESIGVVVEDAYIQWNIKPFLSVHRLSNENKKLQEFYLSNFTFAKDNSLGYSYYKNNEALEIRYHPIQKHYFRFILGYASYKKVEKLSKGIFNFYYGTRLEYAFNDYKETPTTAIGYEQQYKHHGLRLSFATTMLWNVSKKWQIETKITPLTFLAVSTDWEKSESPVFNNSNDGRWIFNNSSSLNLMPVIQLGVKYHLKTIKTRL